MSVFSGDFLGFQIGNIHSSQLNITRVSSNNRYNDTLIPNFSDSTAAIPGGDGTYYWKTQYSQKPISIDFAFDNLSGDEIHRLRQVLGFKGVQQLIFDELPYKKYMVKCSNPPTLKYIAFQENYITIYKGEGTVNLVAFYPYALSTVETELGSCINYDGQSYAIISNAGDIEMPVKLIFPIESNDLILNLDGNNGSVGQMTIKELEKQKQDKYYCVDMRTHLIEGMDEEFNKTGMLYNRFVESGDFFNIPVGIYTLTATQPWEKVKYNYLYY